MSRHLTDSYSNVLNALPDSLKLFGAASALTLVYKSYRLLSPYFTPSKLHRYHHGRPGSTWALITGASDGIGYGFACSLLDHGFNVLLHGRNEQKLNGIQGSLSKKYPQLSIRYVVADASEQGASHDHIVAAARDLPGKLTILINNVGGTPASHIFNSLSELPASHIDTLINMNARWPTQLTKALLPLLTDNSPSLIMNVGSMAGLWGLPYLSVYCASKAFNMLFSDALKQEIAAEGKRKDIEVIGIIVGNVLSAGNTSYMAGVTATSRQMADASLARVGCGRSVVWGWWRHAVLGTLMSTLLPTSMLEDVGIKEMSGRRAELRKEA